MIFYPQRIKIRKEQKNGISTSFFLRLIFFIVSPSPLVRLFFVCVRCTVFHARILLCSLTIGTCLLHHLLRHASNGQPNGPLADIFLFSFFSFSFLLSPYFYFVFLCDLQSNDPFPSLPHLYHHLSTLSFSFSSSFSFPIPLLNYTLPILHRHYAHHQHISFPLYPSPDSFSLNTPSLPPSSFFARCPCSACPA